MNKRSFASNTVVCFLSAVVAVGCATIETPSEKPETTSGASSELDESGKVADSIESYCKRTAAGIACGTGSTVEGTVTSEADSSIVVTDNLLRLGHDLIITDDFSRLGNTIRITDRGVHRLWPQGSISIQTVSEFVTFFFSEKSTKNKSLIAACILVTTGDAAWLDSAIEHFNDFIDERKTADKAPRTWERKIEIAVNGCVRLVDEGAFPAE